jgi:hypothetical protein
MDQARAVGSAFLLHVRTDSLVSQVGLHAASGKRLYRGGTVRPHRRTHADRSQVRESLRLWHGALQIRGVRMKHIVNFHDAMTLVFLGVILVAYVVCLVGDRVRVRSEQWYTLNHPVTTLQARPWYVRLYEFLNE